MVDIVENPQKVDRTDIVVGIPSYNEAEFISYPTLQASIGLEQFFKEKRSVIINCDNNSDDGTKEKFLDTPTAVPKIYISTPPGVKGKGNNLINLFKMICELHAKVCIIVDADLKSITPRWIRNLGEPLFNNFGFVAPLYIRHKYDGTITNNIAYPFIRALYGRRIRQPIGGDFGISGKMAHIFLETENWDEMISQYGIDIWMTIIAITHRIPVCQSFMGRPKIHKLKDPGADLGPMFRQILGTLFSTMQYNEQFWQRVRWSKPTAIFGFGLGEVELPPPVEVNKDRLYQRFFEGFNRWEDFYRSILSEGVFNKLIEVKGMKEDQFEFPTQLWAMVIFDMAVAYNKNNTVEKNRILDSLLPLYFGKTFSFVRHTEGMSAQQAEEYIENQCLIFEETKPFLNERWNERWKD